MDSNYFLNRREEIQMDLSGKLPHWCQDGTLQFITMRVPDSLPSEIIKDVVNRRQSFILNHPKPWTEQEETDYNKIVGDRLMKYLDQGYGECPFKKPEARSVIDEALMFHDGKAYSVLSYVLMPNHIHMIVLFNPSVDISETISNFKRFTTREVNKRLNRSGALWQREYYDRILRSPAHLDYCLAYIDKNPESLPSDWYTLYHNPTLIHSIK